MFNIVEFTNTVHGEMPNIGKPCTLIRVAECNLHCPYCDAQGLMSKIPTTMTSSMVLWQLKNMTHMHDILLTGGEPMVYGERMVGLLAELVYANYQVVLETNGTYPLGDVPEKVQISMDLKLLDEVETHMPTIKDNLRILGKGDILKVVLTSDEDTTMALDWIESNVTYPTYYTTVFSSTPEYAMPVAKLLQFQEAHPLLHVKLQAQLHKVWEVA